MAEVLLFTGTGKYEDGDILCAFNDRRISQVHVHHICHIKHAGFNSDGLRPENCLPKKMAERVYQYAFFRVSQKEIQRVNLWSDKVDLISDTPNADSEAMDVALYIKRRIKHPGHGIFGTTGNEFWFGGRTDPSIKNLDSVWAQIETDTSYLKNNHKLWPLTKEEKKRFLGLRVDVDFNDPTRADMEAPLYDNGDVVKKRKTFMPWSDLVEIPTAVKSKVGDRAVEIEARNDFALNLGLKQIKTFKADTRVVG